MPEFSYRAKTTTGSIAEGVLTANTHRDALTQLTQQSLFPLDVQDRSKSRSSFGFKLEFGNRVKTETIADTLTGLSDLLSNGVSLLESLTLLSEQATDEKMGEVLKAVRDAVADGTNLDEALAEHPQVFSHLTTSMVRAGLEGAFLEEALERVSSFLRKQDEIRGKVVGAMTYPIILAIVGCVVTVVLVTVIVPMFEPFFERLERSGTGLPWITVALLFVSHAIVKYGWLLAIGAALGVLGIKKLLSTNRAQRFVDEWKLRVPLVGPIFHDTSVSRFCRVLGTLLQNGVPILRSLDISSSSAGNVLLEEAIQSSAENISSGNLLSQPLAESGLIPPQVMAMIRVAEESNSLDDVLIKISNRMDQKTERKLTMLVRLIEPLMLLLIGAMVAFIIIGVLLPVFDINSAID